MKPRVSSESGLDRRVLVGGVVVVDHVHVQVFGDGLVDLGSAYVFLGMLAMNLLPILNTDGQKVLTTIMDVDKTKEWRSESRAVVVIHVLSILALGIIVGRLAWEFLGILK